MLEVVDFRGHGIDPGHTMTIAQQARDGYQSDVARSEDCDVQFRSYLRPGDRIPLLRCWGVRLAFAGLP